MPANAYPSLMDRAVLVTGGSRGLGKAMALALAEAGARIAITGKLPSRELDETAAALQAVRGKDHAMAITADVRSVEECKRTADDVRSRFGRIDVLINNAGLGMRPISETYIEDPPKFWEADPIAWRGIIDTNVTGVFNMSRFVAPGMVAQGFGKIINISTSLSVMVRRGQTPYGPSKAALESISRIWAADLAGTGVDVNVFLPGVATNGGTLPDKRRAEADILPASILRPGILWLCADESNGHTGGRYVARLWDESLPPDEAAIRASEAWPL